jgi:hypothetical protein
MVRSLSSRKLFPVLLVLFSLLLVHPPTAAATTVKVEALGFFSHPPMAQTANAIKDAAAKFGSQVQLVMHDETTDDGTQFMQARNLSGHLPMVLWIDGSVAHKVGARTVVFRDFLGQGWTQQDLEQVIRDRIAGKDTAVAAPANAETEQWNPSAIPAGMRTGATSGSTQSATLNLVPYVEAGVIILLLVLMAYLFGRRTKRG